MPHSRRLVVSVGNPLAGDDGIGPAVTLALAERGDLSGADILDAGTDLLAHVDALARYDEVFLIDAVIDPSRVGEVSVVEQETLLAWPERSPGAHAISPLVAIKLFRALYPAASTRFSLIAFFTDAIRMSPCRTQGR
jgi:hydrogenase maturation protease